MSALLMASPTPNEDLALLQGEYAAIRPATRIERKRLGLAWPQRAFAVVLRSCAGIETVIFPTSLTSHFLTTEKLNRVIDNRGISRSVAVIAFALRIYPSLLDMLRDDRSSASPCQGCNCIWKTGGVFDFGSDESAAVAGLVDDHFQRAAA